MKHDRRKYKNRKERYGNVNQSKAAQEHKTKWRCLARHSQEDPAEQKYCNIEYFFTSAVKYSKIAAE